MAAVAAAAEENEEAAAKEEEEEEEEKERLSWSYSLIQGRNCSANRAATKLQWNRPMKEEEEEEENRLFLENAGL